MKMTLPPMAGPARPGAEPEDGLGVSRLVIVRGEHIVDAIVPGLFQEPLDVRRRKIGQLSSHQVD
jgi:hypothetical protein